MRVRLSERRLAVLFLIPAAILLIVFYYYPIVQTLIYSVFDLDHTTDWLHAPFVGLGNYIEVVKSSQFWLSMRFTLYFTVLAVFLEFWLGLGMAMSTFWVTPKLRWLLRTLIIIPWAIPQVIQASMWKWLFDADMGLIGDLLMKLGVVTKAPLFLVNPTLAVHSVIAAYVWKMACVTAIFLMGGLAMVPQHLVDAAKMDGARSWMRFWKITLPLIKPTIFVALLFRVGDGLRVFDIVYGLTGGGPGTMTDTLSSFAYKFYFRFVQFGLGSAYAVVTFILVFSIALYYIRKVYPHFTFKG